jgi:hypothetical protein
MTQDIDSEVIAIIDATKRAARDREPLTDVLKRLCPEPSMLVEKGIEDVYESVAKHWPERRAARINALVELRKR